MVEKCNHCGAFSDFFLTKEVWYPEQTEIKDIIREIAHNAGRYSQTRSLFRNHHATIQRLEKIQIIDSNLTLNNLLPDDHPVFAEIEKNAELENSEFDNRRNPLARFEVLHDLANSKRKFAKKTRDWMKHKSPFMDEEFNQKLRNKNAWSKNLREILDEPCQRKEVICTKCGTVVRTFIEMQEKVEMILESVKTLRTYLDYLSRYDSAMTNWERDDNVQKEKAKKIRQEKKLQAELEALEAQRRSAEEKLRKLQDE